MCQVLFLSVLYKDNQMPPAVLSGKHPDISHGAFISLFFPTWQCPESLVSLLGDFVLICTGSAEKNLKICP